MKNHKELLIKQLKRLIYDIGISKVIIGEKTPEVSLPREILPFPRIIIPLSGEKKIFYAADKQVVQGMLKAGEALFVPSLCCTRACWSISHEMISIVMHKNMLRILYINYHESSGQMEMHPVSDAFYHVKYYKEVTKYMFQALSALSDEDSECAVKLADCLLEFSLKDIELSTSSESKTNISCVAWPEIIEYIHNNITEDITRDRIAEIFRFTPQYISRLFQKNAGLTFKAFLTAERMKRAAELLVESNLTVDEISWECGYPYTSYFIRIFQKYHGNSPGVFRRLAVGDKKLNQ
jgi:YesN/AraC family two-component response regulator